MKLNKLFLLTGLLIGAFCLAACGDDDNHLEPPVITKEQAEQNKKVVGTYKGWSHLTTNFINKNYDGDIVELIQDEDGTLTAIYTNKTWGTATCKGINAGVITSDGKTIYPIVQGIGEFVMYNPRTNTTQTFPCELTGGFVSLETGLMEASFVADMTSVEGGHGMMAFTFQTGEMPTE